MNAHLLTDRCVLCCRQRFWYAVVVIVALLAGCAGSGHFRTGEKLMESGQYDQAIEAFNRAIAEDPDNTRYRLQLAEAQSRAADQHVARARELLDARRASDAQFEAKIALEQMPAHPEANRLLREIDETIARCEQRLAEAKQALDRQVYEDAARLASQARDIDQSHPAVAPVLDEARQGAVRVLLEQARLTLESRDWARCEALLAEARQYDENNEAVAQLARTVADRQEALRLVDAAAPLTARGSHVEAINMLQQATARWPENPEITAALERAVTMAIGDLVIQADTALTAGDYRLALRAVDQALTIVPGREDLIERRDRALQSWARTSLEEFERQAMAGHWELAWPAAVRALALSSQVEVPAKQAALRAEQQIRDEIAYSLSVIPMPSSTAGMDAALTASHALVQHLTRVKPEHVTLLERANLAQVLAEHDLSMANITNPERLGALGRQLDNPDILVFVDLSARESTDRRLQERGVSKFVAGRKLVPNPDYATAEAELREAEKQLAQARAAAMMTDLLTDGGDGRRRPPNDKAFLERAAKGVFGLQAQRAAERYNAALLKVSNTPQRLEVDDWREHQYPIYRVERQVTVRAQLRLVEVTTGRILWSDNQAEATATDADTLVEADQQHGVAGKSAVLKEPAELQAEAVDRLDAQLALKAGQLLTNRSLVYWEDAQKTAGDDATIEYVHFLFDAAAGVEPARIDAALDGIFGRDFAGEQLEKCKQIAAERVGLRFSPPGGGTPTVSDASTPVEGTPRGSASGSPAASGAQASPPVGAIAASPSGHVDEPAGTARPNAEPQPAPASPETREPVGRTPPPRSPDRREADQPAESRTDRVFRGSVSREDDRFEKELETVDGIVVKVEDTDGDPLDADLEIRVGSYVNRYSDQPVGARITGRGQSGTTYRVVILAIDDDEETVHFAIEIVRGD
jgi:tetratricopeptide (TPR) repeat protein